MHQKITDAISTCEMHGIILILLYFRLVFLCSSAEHHRQRIVIVLEDLVPGNQGYGYCLYVHSKKNICKPSPETILTLDN